MRPISRPGPVLTLVVLSLFVVVACGDDDDNAAEAATDAPANPATAAPVVTPEPRAEPAAEPTAAPPADPADGDGDDAAEAADVLDFGAGSAVVTIGDETYEFDATSGKGVCRDVFGIIQVSANASDGRDIDLNMTISPTDWETYTDDRYDPPQVQVDIDETGGSWIADAAFAEEWGVADLSQIDDYEMDGLHAKGTATFVDRRAAQSGQDAESVAGTFEVRCEEA